MKDLSDQLLAIYQETSTLLKQNKVHRQYLDPSKEKEVFQEITNLDLKKIRESDLIKALMIVNFRFPPTVEFTPWLLEILTLKKDQPEVIILALQTTQKHILDYSFQSGKKINKTFFTLLADLLTNKSYEVQEWSLRMIEACQGHAIVLKKEIANYKSPLLKLGQNKKNLGNLHILLKQRFNIK